MLPPDISGVIAYLLMLCCMYICAACPRLNAILYFVGAMVSSTPTNAFMQVSSWLKLRPLYSIAASSFGVVKYGLTDACHEVVPSDAIGGLDSSADNFLISM